MERPLGDDGRFGHRMTHKLGWPTCRWPVAGGVGEQPEALMVEGAQAAAVDGVPDRAETVAHDRTITAIHLPKTAESKACSVM